MNINDADEMNDDIVKKTQNLKINGSVVLQKQSSSNSPNRKKKEKKHAKPINDDFKEDINYIEKGSDKAEGGDDEMVKDGDQVTDDNLGENNNNI